MKFSKQALLGTTVFLGGSVLLYATVQQVLNTSSTPKVEDKVAIAQPVENKNTNISNNPLTADLQTEKNILAQKQKERELRVEAQEREAQQYLTEQQRIEAEALARSRAENQLYISKNAAPASATATVITQPVVKPRPVEIVPPTTQPVQITPSPATPAPKPAEVVAPKPQPTTNDIKPVITTPKTSNTQPATHNQHPTTVIPSTYQVKAGEGLIGLSRRYNIPVEVLAEVNNIKTNSNLSVGQTLTIPSPSQVNRIEQQAKQREQQRQNEILQKQQAAERKKQEAILKQQQEVARKKQEAELKEQQKQQEIARKKQEAALKEQKRQQEIAQKKLEAEQKQQQKQQYQAAQDKLKQARQEVKETDAKGNFGVQVALATDEKKAQEITQKLQAAGYRVKTTKTTKGVRIVVGPEKGKVAALALKDKINNDSRVDVKNGWVLYW